MMDSPNALPDRNIAIAVACNGQATTEMQTERFQQITNEILALAADAEPSDS